MRLSSDLIPQAAVLGVNRRGIQNRSVQLCPRVAVRKTQTGWLLNRHVLSLVWRTEIQSPGGSRVGSFCRL